MLTTSTVDSCSFTESSPSPIKAADNSLRITNQQKGGTSLLMHSSFGIHRRHSDDVASTSFTTTTFRPRRSISSSAGQQQTRHIACTLNNYSHSLSSPQQITNDDVEDDQQVKDAYHNLTEEQEEDSFNDDDEDIANELNLAVVVGNEDVQSLKDFTTEPTNIENGSLDVAFIDETDVERNSSYNKRTSDTDQPTLQSDILNGETSNIGSNVNRILSQTTIAEHNQDQENSTEIQNSDQKLIQSNTLILVDKVTSTNENLDDILRRNENRCIRLTDSDVNSNNFIIGNKIKYFSLG